MMEGRSTRGRSRVDFGVPCSIIVFFLALSISISLLWFSLVGHSRSSGAEKTAARLRFEGHRFVSSRRHKKKKDEEAKEGKPSKERLARIKGGI